MSMFNYNFAPELEAPDLANDEQDELDAIETCQDVMGNSCAECLDFDCSYKKLANI